MRLLLTALLSLLSVPAWAQVDVSAAWSRPTVQGQMGTGAFMTLKARERMWLVGVGSPVAGVAEIHEMALENNVMRMRAIESLELPAGRAVELKPGGHHLMLMDLQRPLKAGEKVRVELRLKTADNRLVTQPIEVEVRARAPEPAKK